MRIEKTGLEGIVVLQPNIFQDQRGTFVKTFHSEMFAESGLETNFKESFYSHSKKNVIRGMHFQLPPFEHTKLVYVPYGKIMDVVVDIRKKSATYGKFIAEEISHPNGKSILIPPGFAHGFISLSDNSVVVYATSTIHHPEADSGIRWDSFGYDWGIYEPIISMRDKSFIKLSEFRSPF